MWTTNTSFQSTKAAFQLILQLDVQHASVLTELVAKMQSTRSLARNLGSAGRIREVRPLPAHFPPPPHCTAPPSAIKVAGSQQRRWQTTKAAPSRGLHHEAAKKAAAAVAPRPQPTPAPSSSNPALSFPCLDAAESRSLNLHRRSQESGPEPSYTTGWHQVYHSSEPFLTDWGGVLPEFDVAFETWGELNADKSNAILLHTGLSASSHAHSTPNNPKPGWWEKFIGPDKALDTNKYYVICTNVIGGCFGSTGPSSVDPANGERYATRFPILTMEDMVRAQFRLLDALGISKLYASVGASMGGMQSLAAGILFSDRVGKLVSISGCARSHPYSIAMRHTQRQGEYPRNCH